MSFKLVRKTPQTLNYDKDYNSHHTGANGYRYYS